jgi:uncharacterized protein with PIN domain
MTETKDVFAVRLSFSEDLTFFLKPKSSKRTKVLREKTSVEDIIESCGVPHAEVDVIVANGCAVDFSHTVAADAEVLVAGVAALPELFPEKRLQTRRVTSFVADGHLGKLARILRLLGFDVAYDKDANDAQLLATMLGEHRALLTRDRRLLMHSVAKHGRFLRSQNAEEQAAEVIERFDLAPVAAPHSRCLACNAPLEYVAKADVLGQLEPLTRRYYHEFRRCTRCARIYWRGSHFEKLECRVRRLTCAEQEGLG